LKRQDLLALSELDLKTKLKDNQDALLNLRFQKVLQQLDQPQKICQIKREIAQIKTALREIELSIRKENRG